MDGFTQIVFRVTEETYGSPFPYIPNESILLLIQEGTVELSRYYEATRDAPDPSLEHPPGLKQNEQLRLEVTQTIKDKFPQYLESETAVILTCPASIAARIVW